MKRKGCNNDRSAGIEIWLCIDIENRKTFDVFVMIWCVLGWLRPVGEIRAEKRAVQSISFHHSYLLIVLHKTKKNSFVNQLTRRFNASSRRIGR